jgi:hypothetical protein
MKTARSRHLGRAIVQPHETEHLLVVHAPGRCHPVVAPSRRRGASARAMGACRTLDARHDGDSDASADAAPDRSCPRMRPSRSTIGRFDEVEAAPQLLDHRGEAVGRVRSKACWAAAMAACALRQHRAPCRDPRVELGDLAGEPDDGLPAEDDRDDRADEHDQPAARASCPATRRRGARAARSRGHERDLQTGHCAEGLGPEAVAAPAPHVHDGGRPGPRGSRCTVACRVSQVWA